MDLNESAEEQAFRLEVRAFVRDQLPVEIRDKVLKFQHLEKSDYVTWHRILGARGWGAPTWPKEYGGTGWSGVQRVIFEQECMEAGAPRLLAAVNMIGPILMRYGTPEQQAYFLPKTRDMDIVWCQGYSEPGAGSDLASLRTRAERQGDHYVVLGRKASRGNFVSADRSEYARNYPTSNPHDQRLHGIHRSIF
jgi:alkylation response protein AidB-like acyl-CoA dehydrogenase